MAVLTKAQIEEKEEVVAAAEFANAIKAALAGERATLTPLFVKYYKTPEAIAALTASALGIAFSHIHALTRRCEHLEARPQLKYCGTWTGLETYPESSLVTRSGGLWLSTAASLGQRPGDGAGPWKLIVISGDAR